MTKFSNIVYVLNADTDETSSSLRRAISLASLNQADLTLLKILPEMPAVISAALPNASDKQFQDRVWEQERDKLQALLKALDAESNIQVKLGAGKKYIETIRAVNANNYDLMVKEVENVDWIGRLFGSEDMHLLRKCPCPVWLMKKDEKPEYKNIMVAIDFDDELEDDESIDEVLNQKLLDLSASLSLSDFTTLHIVNAYDVPQAGFIGLWVDQPEKIEKQLFETEYRKRQQQMNTLMEGLERRMGAESFSYLSPRAHIVQGPPARELPKLADKLQADLVIMGTVARTGIAGVLIGNTAENVLSQLQCSVLAIKPEGFVYPVV